MTCGEGLLMLFEWNIEVFLYSLLSYSLQPAMVLTCGCCSGNITGIDRSSKQNNDQVPGLESCYVEDYS